MPDLPPSLLTAAIAAGVTTPILSTRIVGPNVELHLLGGRIVTLPNPAAEPEPPPAVASAPAPAAPPPSRRKPRRPKTP